MEAVVGGSGTALLLLAGYALLKRFKNSSCHSDSGCLECDSPAIELAREQTERLDEQSGQLKQIMSMLKGVRLDPESLELRTPTKGEEKKVTTSEVERVRGSSSSYLDNSLPDNNENPPGACKIPLDGSQV